MKVLLAKLQLRHGTAAAWVAANPVLLDGEFGYESDTGKAKLGDGLTAWNGLGYFAGGAGTNVATDIIWDTKGDLAAATGPNAAVKLPVGTDGHVLTADSGEATGIKWAVGGGGVTDHGALTGLADNDHPQYQRVLVQTLSDGANIAWDLNLGGQAVVTLGGNRTLDNPTNLVAGAIYTLRVIQDGTGTRLLTFDTAYLWPKDVPPTLSATAGATDVLVFLCDGTNMIPLAAVFDVR